MQEAGVERIPMVSATSVWLSALPCVLAVAASAYCVAAQGLFEASPCALILLVAFLWMGAALRGRARVVVADASGISLEQRGRVVWAVPWTDLAAWQRVVSYGGHPVALRLFSTSGTERRIGLGWTPGGFGRLPLLVVAIREHAPLSEERPRIRLSAWSPNRRDWEHER